jgi:hypothetical protein
MNLIHLILVFSLLFFFFLKFTGPISETFGSVAKLRDLRLGRNKLTGELPRSLTKLSQLRSLSLRCNMLVGPLDAIRWGNITQLQHLDLGQNPTLGGRLEVDTICTYYTCEVYGVFGVFRRL